MSSFAQVSMQQAVSEFSSSLERYRVKTYRSKQSLLFQGEVPEYALVVKDGIVRVYDIGLEGEEKIVAFRGTYDVLPTAWIFERSRTARYYYAAVTKVEAWAVNRQELLKRLQSDNQLQAWYLSRFVSQCSGAIGHIRALENSKAPEKLLRLMHYLSTRFGDYIQPDIVKIDVRLTQQDIASMSGLSRETTAVELGKLRREGVISCIKQRYFFKETALFKRARIDEMFLLSSLPETGDDASAAC